jgi:hypothetical protein
VVVLWQDGTTLQALRRNATDGLGVFGPGEVFGDLDSGDNQFTAVGVTIPAGGDWLVVAEAIDQTDFLAGGFFSYSRMVAWKRIDPTIAAAVGVSQWRYNLQMISRPWVWASGTATVNEAYVGCAFKSVSDGQEFDQSFAFVVCLSYNEMSAAPAGALAPIPTTAVMGGSVDARPHGQAPTVADLSVGIRMNHLSHATDPPQYPLGPDHASILFATITFNTLVQTQDGTGTELIPGQAGVGYIRHYHTDPWQVRQDPKQPAQPDAPSWVGSTARTMAQPLETAGGLVLTGGVTSTFDGQQLVELGFMHAPEIVNIDPVGGGSMDDAETYTWFANYVWVDARGQRHRSPPSRPVSQFIDAGQFAELTIRPCALSMKDDTYRYPTSGPINIEIWRTYTENGVIAGSNTLSLLFRREYAGDVTGFQVQNTPVSDNSDYVQVEAAGRPNSEIRITELAPFQLSPQTLQWTPPPPVPHRPLNTATVWDNRVFGTDPEDTRVIWYSEPILPLGTQYVKPEFIDTNVFRFDGFGEITAMIAMDAQLIVFTRDNIYALSGLPATGGGGASLDLSVLQTGVGCIEPRSVVLGLDGVYFQSAKGIHRLDRGTNPTYTGAPVEDIVNLAGNIRGAVHIDNRFEVRFSLNAEPGSGPLEVRPRIATWNYETQRWSVRHMPNLGQTLNSSRLNEMQAATSWRGQSGEVLHVALAQGGLGLERSDDDLAYADEAAGGTQAIPLDITTEWIHLAGISGLKRLKEIGIQTERVDAGEMTIEAWFAVGQNPGYDDSGPPDQVRVYASPAPAYLRFRPRIEKCSGIKLRIYESGVVPQTENVRLVSMSIRYGKKPSQRRVGRAS